MFWGFFSLSMPGVRGWERRRCSETRPWAARRGRRQMPLRQNSIALHFAEWWRVGIGYLDDTPDHVDMREYIQVSTILFTAEIPRCNTSYLKSFIRMQQLIENCYYKIRTFPPPLRDKFLSNAFHSQKCVLYSGALNKINRYEWKNEIRGGWQKRRDAVSTVPGSTGCQRSWGGGDGDPGTP